jgi:poly(3-hydroxybutyrate) depolymerase
MKAVKKVFVALSAILVWTAIPAVSAHAVSIGQACAKTTLGTRVSIRVSKKPVIVVCRNVAGRKKWIRAAVQTLVTTTTSTSTTSTTTTVPEPVISYTDVVDPIDPTLHTITIEGMQPRTYYLNIPPNYSAGSPVPLLIGLHGLGGSAGIFREQSQLDLFTSDANVISVFPNGFGENAGTANSWNAGTCCGLSQIAETNDVKFISVIIQNIKSTYSIDPKNVWAVGFSNGGMLSYRLACELSDQITAIGVGAGSLMVGTCSPPNPVSLIHVHGGLDIKVPLTGGGGFSVPDSTKAFQMVNSANKCSGMTFFESVGTDKIEISGNCFDGTEAKLVNYVEQEHNWSIFWTKEILRFLFAHPRK